MTDLAKLDSLLEKFKKQVDGIKLQAYAPYGWQKDFHAAGVDHPERMLMAANRVGKTQSAGAETSIHLTGDYDAPWVREVRYPEFLPHGKPHPNAGELVFPDGWQGRRFAKPVLAWTGSPTNETSKDIVQNELLGGLGEKLGTGWIPRARIVGQPTTRQAGVKGVVDSFTVRHSTGGLSTCILKTYEQGWQKWQGTAPHVVWLDEEPDDYMIYSEAQTRILTSKGMILVTFTPLLGVTDLVQHFQEGGDGIYLKGATWDDAPHLSDEDKARLSSAYRDHEREARTKGVPMMGEGAVFPVPDEQIKVQPIKIPSHWAQIKGCDFGIDHPAAGAHIAWDRDTDTIYLIDCYRKANELPPYHAAWFNKGNRSIPVAWPHDGMNREKKGGGTIAQAYRELGVNMLGKSARYRRGPGESQDKGGPQAVEPIVNEMLDRMVTGKFKVFANCGEFLEEKRSYHRRDGLIVAKRDDILKATFYAVMMKRYAVAPDSISSFHSSAPSMPIASARIA